MSASAHAYAYWVTAATPLKLDSRPVTGYADTATYVSASTDVSALQAELDQLKNDLADAQTALREAIDKKASSEELTKAIADLTAAYKAADALLKSELQNEIDDDVKELKNALEAQLADAKKTLENAVAKVEKDLADAKKELQAAVDTKASSTELAWAVSNLTYAYKTADDALKVLLQLEIDTDVAALKTEIETQLADAKKALQDTVDKVQKDIEKATADLNKAIADGDKAIGEQIAALDAAYKAADALLNTQLSDKINTDISNLKATLEVADANLKDAIEKLQGDLAALDKKTAETDDSLSTKITVLIVMLAITDVALIGLAVTFIISKKRKA